MYFIAMWNDVLLGRCVDFKRVEALNYFSQLWYTHTLTKKQEANAVYKVVSVVSNRAD